jgi:hypothetical protein
MATCMEEMLLPATQTLRLVAIYLLPRDQSRTAMVLQSPVMVALASAAMPLLVMLQATRTISRTTSKAFLIQTFHLIQVSQDTFHSLVLTSYIRVVHTNC